MPLVLFVLTVCARAKIHQAKRVGHFTFDQAVAELDPRFKQAHLSDGSRVAD